MENLTVVIFLREVYAVAKFFWPKIYQNEQML